MTIPRHPIFINQLVVIMGQSSRRYQELIDSSLNEDLNSFVAAAKNVKSLEELELVFKNTNALNMLNAKYVIYNQDAPPLVNKYALGNAWFVEKPVMVENADKELSSINRFNPSSEALIDIRFKDQITKTAYPLTESDSIRLVSYKPDELVYKYSASDEKLAVFSEIYYPAGWKSYIDGKECNYFRTDYVLRGMVVPGGDHEIKFSFEPASYNVGNKVSMASSLLLILLIAGYISTKLIRRPKS